MENIFLVKRFDAGWGKNNLKDIDSQEAFCICDLEIPDEKIYGTEMHDSGLEIILTDISQDEIFEDWYVNLNRLCA